MQSPVVPQLFIGLFMLIGALLIVSVLVNVLESRANDHEAEDHAPPPIARPI